MFVWWRKEQIQTRLEFMVSQEASHSPVLFLTQIQIEVLPHSLYDRRLSALPIIFLLLALLLALPFVSLLPLLAFALLGLALLAFASLWGLCQLPVGNKKTALRDTFMPCSVLCCACLPVVAFSAFLVTGVALLVFGVALLVFGVALLVFGFALLEHVGISAAVLAV